MKTILQRSAMILLTAVGTFAQVQPPLQSPPIAPRFGPPGTYGGGYGVAQPAAKPSTKNYQIELTIQRGDKTARYKLTLNSGSVNTELIDRFNETEDGGAPRTISFSLNLSPFDDGGGEAVVTINRLIPFKTKAEIKGVEKEVTLIKSIPLMTKVALTPGEPVMLFEDEQEKISLTLSESGGDSSARAQCISNLRQIDGAQEQWALENKAKLGDAVSAKDVALFIKGGMPHCPDGGVYTIGAVGAAPRCSIPAHSLQSR